MKAPISLIMCRNKDVQTSHLPGVLQHMPLLISIPWHDAVDAAKGVWPLLRAKIGPAGLKVPEGCYVLPEFRYNKVVHRQLAAICESDL